MKHVDEFGPSGPSMQPTRSADHGRSAMTPASSNGKKDIFSIWAARIRARRALATMEERQLRDIGLDRGSAMAEAAKPFWRA